MKKLISDEYKKQLEEMHKNKEGFGANCKKYVGHLMDLLKSLDTHDVLDYGCGKGMLQQNMPFLIKQYDPAIKVHSLDPEPADLLFCGDVLEHIEPDCIENVIEHMASKTKKIALIVVSGNVAKKTLPDGRNAHLLVKDGAWWFSKISEYYTIISYTNNKIDEGYEIPLQDYLILASPKEIQNEKK